MPSRKSYPFDNIGYLTIIAVLLINYNTYIVAQDGVTTISTNPQNISSLNTTGTPHSDVTTALQSGNSTGSVTPSTTTFNATFAPDVTTVNVTETLQTENATSLPSPKPSNVSDATTMNITGTLQPGSTAIPLPSTNSSNVSQSTQSTVQVSLESTTTLVTVIPPTTVVPSTETSNISPTLMSSPSNSSTLIKSTETVASTTPSEPNVLSSNQPTTTPIVSTQKVNITTSATDQTVPVTNNTSAAGSNNDNKTESSTSTGTIPPTQAPSSNKLSISFVNDLRYDVFPVHPDNGSLCENDKDECIGGLSRLGSYIQTVRASQKNNLWLNAGNMLGGHWFKILKYSTALEAMEFLQFNFVGIGSDVFHYGREASELFLEELQSKVLISNIDVPNVWKSGMVTFGKCNVSVIGFVDDTNLQEKGSHDISVNSIIESLINELNETQLQSGYPSELITIAIGSTSRENANRIANNTEGIDIILYSGNCSVTENSTDFMCWDTVNKTNDKTTYVGSLGMKHADIAHRFLVGEVQITFGENCSIENIEHNHFNYANVTRDRAAPNLAKKLFELNYTLTENMKNLTGERENCSVSECLLGNLVTDSMLLSLKGNDFWNGNGSRIAVFPAAQFQVNKTVPQGNVTATSLYDLVKDDSYIYTVSLSGKELNEMIHISVNSKLNNKSVDFLHLSDMLQVQYNTTTSKNLDFLSVKTVPASSASMKLEPIDLSDNNTLYTVTMPFSIFKMEKYEHLLSSVNESRIIFHNVTVVEAMINFMGKEDFLTLPLVGYRQIKFESPPSIPEAECPSNTGTTILVTLVVTALFLGGCYGVWWYVFRRNRPRTSSTMAMMNMD